MASVDYHRVVVTGLGAVSPLGLNTEDTWAGILAGHSGIGPITQFDASGWPVRIAAEVKCFDPTACMERKEVRRTDRFTQLAVAAARMALLDSELKLTAESSKRIGVLVASGVGGISSLMTQAEVLRQSGPQRVSPLTVPMLMLNSASAQVSISLGLHGPNLAIATACAAGSHALGEASEMLKRGVADVILCGGAESAIIPISIAAFDNMGALSRHNDAPAAASRPFDAARDGFVIGEGAGILVLERLEHAIGRGARIYAEVAGYGASGDAYSLFAPDESGAGAVSAMQAAIADAGISPAKISYINAHGTSTKMNDSIETKAIRSVFGAYADKLAVSSTKSMTGHLLGAAGALEAIFSVLAIRDQILPPTINLEHPDPECDLDYVPLNSRQAAVNAVMSNSFGFGGHNASLIFRRWQ